MDGVALVTGATAGIGAATAEALARQGMDVVLMGRRQERLEAMAERLAVHGVTVLVAQVDVRDTAALQRLAKERPEVFQVDVLVNNAGLARGTDPMHAARLEDWQEMVDTNVTGLLSITHLAMPALLERKGHIVNLGSVAGRWVYPGGGVYCATKYAVRALSEGLRYDLQGTGVRVTNIEPGLVETEFSKVRFSGDTEKAAKVYAGAEVLRADDIAETIVWSLSRPAHVNIQEMVVYPTCQAGVRDVVRA